jgi:hypothetical protein
VRSIVLRVALVVVAALTANAALAQSAKLRARTDVTCKNNGLELDCIIKLSNAATGAPLPGVSVTVSADMPSMPLVHNIRPVKAAAGSEPGSYQAKLELEMSGDWALRIDLAGPLRDRVFKPIRVQ